MLNVQFSPFNRLTGYTKFKNTFECGFVTSSSSLNPPTESQGHNEEFSIDCKKVMSYHRSDLNNF